MLKKLRAKHTIIYCLLAEALLVVVLQLGGIAATLIEILIGPVLGWFGFLAYADGVLTALSELAGAALAVFFLARTGRIGLLKQRGCGLFNGLLAGMWILTIVAYNLIVSIYNPPQDAQVKPLWDICWYFAYMLAVGVSEELVARGVIAETLLEHYGTSRKGALAASAVSGLIFGCSHLINIFAGSTLEGVLVQCCVTAVLGALFAAVYFRTGNIWVAVVLHGLNNVAASWVLAVYNTTTLGELVGSYSFAAAWPSMLIYVLPTLFLLRRKKIVEVELYFGKWCRK